MCNNAHENFNAVSKIYDDYHFISPFEVSGVKIEVNSKSNNDNSKKNREIPER